MSDLASAAQFLFELLRHRAHLPCHFPPRCRCPTGGGGGSSAPSYALQSDVIGAMQFIFAAMTLPTLLNRRAYVAPLTSGVTALGLGVISVMFLTMGPLWVSFIGSATCAAAWAAIFFVRSGLRVR